MSKEIVYYEVINTYGKQDGDEVAQSGTIEDTPENRRYLAEDWGFDDEDEVSESDLENFINGKSNNLYKDHYGDWDEPTGREIVITTYESQLAHIEKTYQDALARLNKLFNK